jgi:DNA-binding MarR family transcriptional regulator
MVKKVDWESLSLIFNKMNESPGYHMMMVVNRWDKGISSVLDGYSTTRTQLELLACMAKLMKNGQPITQKDVVDFVHRDKNTVSAVMRTLEKKRFITRTTGKEDQRVKTIVLTDKGFQLIKKAAGEVLLFDEKFFPDESDRKELKRLLKKYL